MTPVLELTGVSKDYRGLRPLRVAQLTVTAGERVALVGFDQAAAEVLVNLITGATLPDQGELRVFGRPTRTIADSAEWLALVDRCGIVSPRAVLLDPLSVVQNLAVPFTLDIEPPPPDVRAHAEALATEAGIAAHRWERPLAELDAAERARVRFARALALDPGVLIVEHITAGVDRDEVPALGADMAAVARRRGAALVALTADLEFAHAVADRVRQLEPSSGRLTAPGIRGWLGRRLG